MHLIIEKYPSLIFKIQTHAIYVRHAEDMIDGASRIRKIQKSRDDFAEV